MNRRISGLVVTGCIAAAPALTQEVSFSTGPATTVIEGLIECGRGSRPSAVGEITSEDGTRRILPAETHFQTAPKAADLYNACAGFEPASLAEVDLDGLENFDAGGSEEFTALIFADNYFELYANGTLLAVDAVPFTPFNSSVIRFRADRPVSLAVLGVDWEENLALGSEAGRGSPFSPGDAGIVMQIRDAAGETVAITDASWRAQTFYTSPITERACLVAAGQTRDSSACSASAASDGTGFSAAFWDIPEGWMQPGFDDSAWPAAVTFTNETVGVNNKPAYTNFTEIFDAPGADAQFIWSSNLVLDNLVLLRKTID
ncbi:hypothetical protein R3X27_21840 [Tropicimonas sp. TH_r6]|uniref:hypothetical protein n=1 Tax=Tropicimonas sp. TH_r6 TaxID=3082085 RepID=UPI0029550EC5|nr:hypothetical protein [Tropicimonas sp. TH_r6]MDV7145335.1 hypothetical protein [Tropicimonas sp. TH_r6]